MCPIISGSFPEKDPHREGIVILRSRLTLRRVRAGTRCVLPPSRWSLQLSFGKCPPRLSGGFAGKCLRREGIVILRSLLTNRLGLRCRLIRTCVHNHTHIHTHTHTHTHAYVSQSTCRLVRAGTRCLQYLSLCRSLSANVPCN